MLIKAEAKRRTEILSKYIREIQHKLEQNKYREAKEFLVANRPAIDDNYLAKYDPNLCHLDSLKFKAKKMREKAKILEREIADRRRKIDNIRIHRGFNNPPGLSHGFIAKIKTESVGIYASRFQLTLDDVHKIDYEQVTLESNFHVIRVIPEEKSEEEDSSSEILVDRIATYEQVHQHLLLTWSDLKGLYFIMLRLPDEELSGEWFRVLQLCDILRRAKLRKSKLFQEVGDQQDLKAPSKGIIEQSLVSETDKSSKDNPGGKDAGRLVQNRKELNLILSNNKSMAYERLRRQTEFVPFQIKNHSKLRQGHKFRKVSEDLTYVQGGYFAQKKLHHFKSQKSFDNKSQPAHKVENRDRKKKISDELKSGREPDKLHFDGSSSIKWIEEQSAEHSNQSFGAKNYQFANEHESQIHMSIGSKNYDAESVSQLGKLTDSQVEGGMFLKTQQKCLNLFPVQSSPENQRQQDYSSPRNIQEEASETQSVLMEDHESDILDEEPESSFKIGLKEQEVLKEESNEESEDPNHQATSNQTSITEKFHLEGLESGIPVIKCAANGWNAHKKLLKMSRNRTQLQWLGEKNDMKKIQLSEIDGIFYRQHDAGILKHIKKNISAARCLTIRTKVSAKEIKNLEFYLQDGVDPARMEEFSMNLKSFISHRSNKV